MRMGLYVIYDKHTGYMAPSCQKNDDTAKRAFGLDIKSDEMNVINVNPADFNLQKIGEYETDTGVITPCNPTIICDAVEFTGKE